MSEQLHKALDQSLECILIVVDLNRHLRGAWQRCDDLAAGNLLPFPTLRRLPLGGGDGAADQVTEVVGHLVIADRSVFASISIDRNALPHPFVRIEDLLIARGERPYVAVIMHDVPPRSAPK